MKADSAEERRRLAEIRRELPAVEAGVYLNSGTAGPLPRSAVAAMKQRLEQELTHGRISPQGWEAIRADREEVRALLARRLHCDVGEIALTARTTDGLNIALWGLQLQAGDEVLTTRHEHPGLLAPLAAVARGRGVSVRFVDWPQDTPEAAAEAFARAMGPRTRVLALSHVLWTNGAVLPLKGIAEAAHARGALVVVDGAQSAGSLPLDLGSLGADFYALPGQKWLLGPEGTGALYAQRDAQALCHPTFTGYLSGQAYDESAAYFLPSPGARRYEVGSTLPAAIIGQLGSLRWQEGIGEDWAARRASSLAGELREELASLPGVDVLTPDRSPASGLVSFCVAELGAPAAARRLQEQGYCVRFLPEPHAAVRASVGFYLLREELGRFAAAIAALRP